MTKAFVSYSRKDTEFTRKLADALTLQQYDLWVDWESIPPTVDWKLQIQKGVEEADTFLFLISPDSIKSRECLNELTLAVTNGKRLIPIVVRQINPDDSPNELKHLNWIFFHQTEEFDKSFQKMLDAINTDYEWVQTHRRLQVKALEWERAGKENSFLLRGRDLEYAEGQLVVNASKNPKPTELQGEFILKSRSAAARQRRTTTAVLVGVAVAMLFLAVAAFVQREKAIENEQIAMSNEKDAIAARADAQKNQKVAEANAKEAENNWLFAQVGEVSSFALEKLDQDYNEALLYSVEAYRLADQSGFNVQRAKSALLGTLQDQFGLAQVLPAHADWVNSIVISQNGRIMASSSADGVSYVWDVSNPFNPIRLFQIDGDDIAINAASTMVAASQYDENFNAIIKLWDISDISKPAAVGKIDGNFVVDFLPDGKSLVIQRDDKGKAIIEVWDIRDPARPRLVSAFEGVSAVLSPDGSILAVAGADEQKQTVITLWNIISPVDPLELGTLEGRFEVYLEGFDLRQTFTFSPDNQRLAVAAFDLKNNAIVEIWDLSDLSAPTRASSFAASSDWVNSLAFNPTGEHLAIGNNNGRIAIWDVTDPLNPFWNPSSDTLTGHSLAVNSMAFTSDGGTLATGSYDGTIMLWDISGIGNPLQVHAPTGITLASAASGDALVTAYYDDQLQTESTLLWDVSDSLAPEQLLKIEIKSDWAVISADHKFLITASDAGSGDAGRTILWDISDVNKPVQLEVMVGGLGAAQFSPDGGMLALSTSTGEEIEFWDTSTAGQVSQLGQLSGSGVVFSPDGKAIAVLGGTDQVPSVQLWDISSWSGRQQVGTLEGSGATFSPDGKLLATTKNEFWTDSFRILLWNVSDPSSPISAPLEGHTMFVKSLAFSPDGSILASVGDDKKVILWDMTDPASPKRGITLRGHSDLINAVAFNQDGSILASGGDDHNIILWHVDGYKKASQFGVLLGGIGYYIDDLRFASDTRLISNNTTLWDMDPYVWMEKACNIAGSNFTAEQWDQLFPDEPYRLTCENIVPEPLVSVEGEFVPVNVGNKLPFCSETTSNVSSCPLLTSEWRSNFCVDDTSYALYAVPDGSTLTPINEGYTCNDEGVFGGDRLYSCYGPPANQIKARVCNTSCSAPLPQSDQCDMGYGLDSSGSCCMPAQSVATDSCLEVTLAIIPCNEIE